MKKITLVCISLLTFVLRSDAKELSITNNYGETLYIGDFKRMRGTQDYTPGDNFIELGNHQSAHVSLPTRLDVLHKAYLAIIPKSFVTNQHEFDEDDIETYWYAAELPKSERGDIYIDPIGEHKMEVRMFNRKLNLIEM